MFYVGHLASLSQEEHSFYLSFEESPSLLQKRSWSLSPFYVGVGYLCVVVDSSTLRKSRPRHVPSKRAAEISPPLSLHLIAADQFSEFFSPSSLFLTSRE
jgi:hypothetical protein